MAAEVLLSTAYLPPSEYFSRIINSGMVYIEKEETYLKQSYRNRCYILASGGPYFITVPVCLGSFHKTPVKDIRIDYSKRWQQVHLRALTSSYRSSPFFIYYYETIENIIQSHHTLLIDLNTALLNAILDMLRIKVKVSFTTEFEPVGTNENDFRYVINPKRKSDYVPKRYFQVFREGDNFVSGLSIIDLLFNTGPDAIKYL